MSRRSYAIVGTGAVGGYYGARLAHAGADVHFLLRSDFDLVRERGLVVESREGDFSLPSAQAYADAEAMPACDVVMVCLKATHNHLLPDILPPLVGEATAVLLMQNGLGAEQEIAGIVPAARIFGGLAFLCSNKVGPGHIRHLDYGQVQLGEHRADGSAAGITDLLESIGRDFESAGIPADLAEDLAQARWRKLVWNVPYNGLTVVLDTTTDRLMQATHTRALCEALMWEVLVGAAACGKPIDESFVTEMMQRTDRMVAYKPSMKLDHEAGRPMEVEAIYGAPLRAAEAAGVELARIEMLYQQLKLLGGSGA
ncbi:MAG: putative 2-dehydropantoate 2-reductase [Phycisphaerae bacterium]|nr:putative 2-dehydropantoate 2-reductase [Phycisphaerae bacterium]